MKTILLPAACCLLTVGCMGLSTSRNPTPPGPKPELLPGMPTAAQLVRVLNDQAAKVTSLESHDLDLDLKAGNQAGAVRGTLFCQKPRNFRLRAKLPTLGTELADIGSNDREFWYHFDKDNPPDLYFCSYADLSRGNVRMPFPLHPDWVLEALGVGAPAPVGTAEEEQARGRTLEVTKTADNNYVDLYERTTSPNGQQVIKVTRFNNFNAQGTRPQVAGYYLYDSRNAQQPICQATVAKVQYDAASGAMVPQRIELKWPSMNLSMVMTLGEISVNNPMLANNPKLFSRPHSRDTKEVDLARATPMMTPTGIQRAGANR